MKAPEMKKTPTALKWLAEKRARLAGELQCAEQVSLQLAYDLADLDQQITALKPLLSAANSKVARIRHEVAAVDQVVVLYDSGINPSDIAPINAWAGNYGKHGALTRFLQKMIRERAPEYVHTKELEIATITHFSLVFEHKTIHRHWYEGSFRGCLKTMVTKGLIERGPDNYFGSNAIGKWRWKQEVEPTLKELRESAASQGSGPG